MWLNWNHHSQEKKILREGPRSPHLFFLDNVTVEFEQVTALKSVQMMIDHQDFLFITGESGAGKTTLLNVLANEIAITSGRVHRPNSEHFIATVFQDQRLIEELSLRDNLQLSYDHQLHRSHNEFEKEIIQLADFLGFKAFLKIKAHQANGGLRQKVALVRALLSHPQVLLADEPTGGMDRVASQRIFELLNFYHTKKQLAVLWATHNRELVQELNYKSIHLNKGQIVYVGNSCFI